MTLNELIELARRNGWEEQSGTAGMFYNLALYRPVGDQREWLELRFLNGKLTAVQHRHPMYPEPRKITQRKTDHVHALLRARRPVGGDAAEIDRERLVRDIR